MGVPTNLIPTPITGLPEYTGSSTLGYLPYVLEGRSYKVQFANIAAVGAVPSSRVIAAGTGLAGGGDLSANRVISIAAGGVGFDQLALSGVVAGTYGSGSAIPILTVDSKGRVTSATTAPLDVTGFVPTSRTITAGDGLTGGGSLANNITLGANFSVVTPSALGVASPGTAVTLSRGDHVHPAVNLSDTTQTQGALPLGRGGTGDALSPVAGAVVYSTGSKFALTNPGIAGQVLVSNGTDEPQWRTVEGAGTVTSVNLTAGTGISVSGGPITVSGSINVVNTAPDQIVTLTGAGTTTISGTYPNFTITSNDSTVGTVTSVAASGGTTGLTFSGSPITSSGTLTLGGTLAVANGGTGASVAGTARTNLGAAASGANTDITSIALTTGTISASPVNGTDIVNKLYADSIASGINFHQSVRLATAAALPANTYNNGASGVGATLTANANAALSVDGVAVVVGNRILVKNETAGANNGVYTVTQTGSGAAPYILTRATDFDSAGTGVDQIDAGDFFLVTAGSTQANTSWVQQTPLPITVGTTAIVFSQFAAPVLYTAGTGLTLAGTVFSITNTGVSASTYGSASSVPVLAINAQGQVTSASSSSIAIAASQVTSGTFTVAQGGTGATSLGANGVLLGNGTSAISATAVGATGQVLVGNTGAAPTWATLSGIGVTSFSAGTTGLTPASATTGAITLAGTLNVANGGTGATSLASGYLVKGNGTSAASASVVYDNGTNVGIGTTSPVSKLDVNGEVSVKGQIFLANDGTSNYIRTGSTGLFIQNSTGASTFATITNTGNVGIGTTSPGEKLTVYNGTSRTLIRAASDLNFSGAYLGTATSTNRGASLELVGHIDSSNSNAWRLLTGQDITGGPDFVISNAPSAASYGALSYTERMRIDTSGNVGIGTTSISDKLTVQGSGNFRVSSGNVGVALSGSGWSYSNYFNAADNSLRWYSSTGGDRMVLDSSGRLAVGITTPLNNNMVSAYGSNQNGFVAQVTNNIYSLYQGFNSSSSLVFQVDGSGNGYFSGNVGIGTTTPLARFVVSNGGNENMEFTAGSVAVNGGVLQYINRATTTTRPDMNYYLSSGGGSHKFYTNDTERMRITSAGNVGIGTTTPDIFGRFYTRTVGINSSGTTMLQINGTTYGGIDLGFNGTRTAVMLAETGGLFLQTVTAAAMYLGTNGLERMRIAANGDVTVGVGGTGAQNTVIYMNGSSNAAAGAVIVGQRNGTNAWAVGDTSSLFGSGTGLSNYVYGANPWIVQTNNTERMRITGDGNVGIGTSAPGVYPYGGKLNVNGSISMALGNRLGWGITDAFTLNGVTTAHYGFTYGGGVNYITVSGYYGVNFATLGADRMRITDTGNLVIGLGATNTAALSISRSSSTASVLASSSIVLSNRNTGINGTIAGGIFVDTYRDIADPHYSGGIWFTRNQIASNLSSSSDIVFGVAGSNSASSLPPEAMRIFSSGDVGISTGGTSYTVSSDRTLTVAGSSFASFNLVCGGAFSGAGLTVDSSANLLFRNTGSERMRIDSSGNVLMGKTAANFDATGVEYLASSKILRSTTSSNAALQLQRTTTDGDVIQFWNAGSLNSSIAVVGSNAFLGATGLLGFSAGGAERARIDSAGNFYVNCTTAGAAVDGLRLTASNVAQFSRTNADTLSCNRNGSDGQVAVWYKAGTAVGSISVTGSATAYNTSSDYRLKDVDGPVTNSGAYIDALKPVQGSWKADGSRFIGLIAHEVQEVSETPIATGEKDGEEMQAMDYSAPELIANLIAEIQSLRARVAQLEGN